MHASGDLPDHTFDLHRCIGVGGFGEVYHATMTAPSGAKREVAVKILHPGIDPTAQAIQRLRDEARLLGLLQHPSIIRVVDLLQYKQRLALVTEFVDGQDLNTCIEAVPPPSPRAMIEIMGRVANALDAAWRTPSPDGSRELHLIHRDIKPTNIRISTTGEVKLLDFGLAHADHADREAQTANHALIGSFLYMAPERYLQHPNSSASDAFGIGCCLYEGLSGDKLFAGRKPVDLYGLLLDPAKWDSEMDARVAAIPNTVAEEARIICRRLISREPEARMTVTELADTWEDIVDRIAGPDLNRWATTRVWPPPEAIKASLEGSVVASRMQVLEMAPNENFEDIDNEPTVRLKSTKHLRDMIEASPAVAQREGFVPEGDTVLRPQLKLPAEPTPEPTAASPTSGRINWLGAAFLALTTAVVVFLLSVVLATVVSVLLNRDGTPVVEEVGVPTLPPQAQASSRVTVTGAHALLQRGRTKVPVGNITPGMWTLWVDFGDGHERIGTLRVPKGANITVPCDIVNHSCTLPGGDP